VLAFGFFAPMILLFVQFCIGHSLKSPRCTWRKPSWRENPFNKREPLQFFDFVGVCFMAFSLAWLVNALRSPVTGVPAPLIVFAVASGVWAAVQLFCLIRLRAGSAPAKG
jgi:hypothetical protein